jgi:hypothetical protein
MFLYVQSGPGSWFQLTYVLNMTMVVRFYKTSSGHANKYENIDKHEYRHHVSRYRVDEHNPLVLLQ